MLEQFIATKLRCIVEAPQQRLFCLVASYNGCVEYEIVYDSKPEIKVLEINTTQQLRLNSGPCYN